MNDKLLALGFSPFFEQQVLPKDLAQGKLARIIEVQRSHLIASDGGNPFRLSIAGSWFQRRTEERPTIGDWLLVDEQHQKIERLLTRRTVLRRLAVGKKVDLQLIAANLDVLFVVTSCNDDFNEARIERYLSMALEASIKPVLVITKSDLVKDPERYYRRVQSIHTNVPVEIINALSPDSIALLSKWTIAGTTIGLVGSSGVGKSTIVNLLCGSSVAQTAEIREQDAKGRHTTSFRSLHQSPSGGLLLDLPGMREVKVAELDSAVNEVFFDIETLATKCRFSDCAHKEEPNCAVLSALDDGSLSERRLNSYRKLLEEEKRQTRSLADQRHRTKQPIKSVHEKPKSKRPNNDRDET